MRFGPKFPEILVEWIAPLRYKRRTGKYGLGIKHGLGIKRGLQTGYKIEILGGGSLNQEPDKNAVFYTHFRHGLGL